MKNIVITGSSRGLGLCMAREFLKAGCNVTVSGRSEKSFEHIRKELDEFSDRVLYIPCNVKIKEELENLWGKSVKKWGKVDIWINNAGLNCPDEFIYKTEQKYVDEVIDTDLKGVIYGSQVAAKNMLSQGSGQIWNMEGLGSNDSIVIKTILYGTSKHALTYFTKGLAKEREGTGVFAGRLSLGMMLTDFINKTTDGEKAEVNPGFQKILNILGDKPETVAEFFAPKILKNTKNNAHIVWLTNRKTIFRFATAAFKKRKLV